ncbi:MAG: hypothetical protein PUB21_08205 [Bacteroidales bacterium]|nr:hypothetical protein [Bacteroidales bacterium]
MKRFITSLLLLLFVINIVNAQDADRKKRIEEYRARHVAYITERVHLTQTEAEKFWPLYNEFHDKRMVLLRNYKKEAKAFKKLESPTEKEYKDIIEKELEVKMKEATLTREYYLKFQKILSPKGLYEFSQAEDAFSKDYLKRRMEKEQQQIKSKKGTD